MNEIKKIEAQIAQMDERRAELDRRLKEAQEKAAEEDRAGRALADEAIGKLVIDTIGDWKSIDPVALRAYLAEHIGDIRESCVGDELSVRLATLRLRGGRRQAKRKAAPAKAKSDVAEMPSSPQHAEPRTAFTHTDEDSEG